MESTVEDFWRMIIQEDVGIIVMVAQFVEQSKVDILTQYYGKTLTELNEDYNSSKNVSSISPKRKKL